jgi:hypothetical protein
MRAFTFFAALSLAACTGSGTDDDDTSSTSDGSGPGPSSSVTDTPSTTSGVVPPGDSSSDEGVIYDIDSDEGTTYLLALSTPLDPALPLQFLAEIAVDDGTLTISLQPLSLDRQSTTEPRLPIGDVLVPAVDFMTPAFSAQLDDAAIPGDANPVSGEDLVVSISLIGSLAGAGTPCGRAEGMTIEPRKSSLAGSTWAATPVSGVDALPADFPVACPD